MKASEASVDQLDPGCLGPTGTEAIDIRAAQTPPNLANSTL